MAITYVATATAAVATTAAATITCNVPAGVANGDLLLWHLAGRAAAMALPGVPAGWTLWSANSLPTTAHGACYWYRFASAEPASYTVSGLTSGSYATNISAYRGVHATTPSDVTPVSATSAAGVAVPAAITPVTAGAWIIVEDAVAEAAASALPTWATTNMSALFGQADGTVAAAANAGVEQARYTAWAAGAFTPNLTTATGTYSAGVALTSALRPAAAAAVGRIRTLSKWR